MNFSDEWRSAFAVAGVFAAPKLARAGSGSASFGPLGFSPSSSSSTLLNVPPHSLPFPSRQPTTLHPLNGLLSDTPSSLSLVSSKFVPRAPSNLVAALRIPGTRSFIFFFPVGPNADCVAYQDLEFCEDNSCGGESIAAGEAQVQQEGFRDSYHRILHLLTVASTDDGWGNTSDVIGYLVASKLYSVSWFRVETRATGNPCMNDCKKKVVLVPVAKRRFEQVVVDVCFSPHIPEESAVLLDDGKLCWFNLVSRKSGCIRVWLGHGTQHELDERDNYLESVGCAFGAQPWTILVVNSKEVLLVDLRHGESKQHKVLARIGEMNLYEADFTSHRNEKILAFCKAKYDGIHISVVTNEKVILLDVRKPLLPILMWHHHLENPDHLAMFRLSELRSSEEFKWASDSGFAILAGSLWRTEFALFCYGPKQENSFKSSPLYAWDNPLSLHISGRSCENDNRVLRNAFMKGDHFDSPSQLTICDFIVGYFILPSDVLFNRVESGGFALVRLMSSGKLELQTYGVSGNLCEEAWEELPVSKKKLDLLVFLRDMEYHKFHRAKFLNLKYLCEYVNGTLSSALAMDKINLDNEGMNAVIVSKEACDLVKELQLAFTSSVDSFIGDVSMITSVCEIALRSAFNILPSSVLCLTFAKYSDIYTDNWGKNFELLEVPSCLPHHKFRPFFVMKPSNNGEKWKSKALRAGNCVGPVLPVPFLLALDNCAEVSEDSEYSSLQDEVVENAFDHQCNEICKTLYSDPVVDLTHCNGWNGMSEELDEEKSFFVSEMHKSRISSAGSEEVRGSLEQSKGKKYTTFVSGKAKRKDCPPSDIQSEMYFSMISDICPIMLDFEPSSNVVEPKDQNVFERLKQQYSDWQNGLGSERLPWL